MKEEFKIPMVVRQKGLIDDTLKVYIENKAAMFIKQMSEKTTLGNRYAALIGRREKVEEEDCIVISGVLKCNCKNHFDLDDYFIKQVRGYLEGQVKKYFKGLEIIGLVSINNMGYEEKNDCIKSAFTKIFKNEYDILYMLNNGCTDIKYILNKKLTDSKGYFVYYDKNEAMQRYVDETDIEIVEEEGEELRRVKKNKNIISFKPEEKVNEVKVKEIDINQEGKTGAMIAMCLSVLSIVLGLGLIKSIDKIGEIEKNVRVMNSSYNVLEEKVDYQNESLIKINKEMKNGYNNEEIIPAFSNALENDLDVEADRLNDLVDNENQATSDKNVEEEIQNNSYIVKPGDSLKAISKNYYGDENYVDAIKHENNIVDENLIKAGQELNMPAKIN